MKTLTWIIVSGWFFIAAYGHSADPIVLETRTALEASECLGKPIVSIHIQGLKRIETAAVLAKMKTRSGHLIEAQQIREDVKSLFKMGYFDDVSVQVQKLNEGIQLFFVFRERPVIRKIRWEGNERLSSSELKDLVKLKEWSILDINRVREDVKIIQKHYEEKGFYLAKVSYDIQSVQTDEVELTYKVQDYDKVQIKKITFLNNKKFSDSQLKSIFLETREGHFFSFLSGSGNFKESAFKQDLQRLTYWYSDHGYIKFRYENPVVTLSDDKKWLYISIYVDEGEPYSIGTLDFGGDLLFSKQELFQELTLNSQEFFSVSKRNTDIQKLTEKYQDLGYAFVNVIPKMSIHEDTKTLDIQYDFEKGNLTYFGEINIVGNDKTYDKVIRRELQIHEGELFNGSRLRRSKENVERLGYFSPGEVLFHTMIAPGSSDRVDIEISVKERSTGTITLGAGYGSYQGFFFTTQIGEINFLGRGQNLSLSAQYSIQRLSQSLNLGFTDPYAFDTLWSLGFDLYALKIPIPYKFINRRQGFDIRVGRPIMDYTHFYMTYKLEEIEDLEPVADIPKKMIEDDSGILSSITFSLIRDQRNNRFETTSGNYQSFTLETAGLGGDMSFLKWVANQRFYTRVIGDLVFRNSAEIGNIIPLSSRGLPPSQKFYLGGPNNMKGFFNFLLGPRQEIANNRFFPTGGAFEAFALFELEYPLLREAGIKGVVFFDVGNAWDIFPLQSGVPFIVRADTGFGIRWFSPFGPLRFEWGFPLAAKVGEESPVFQFFIGPPF